ncbi:hypothetical protein C0991_005323, partial [Blastosporella zonata]
ETAFKEVYCAQIAHASEVTGLAFDAATNHLAVCNRSGIVQLYGLDSTMTLRNEFSILVNEDIPKAIAFGHLGGDKHDILAFRMHSGKL